MIRPAALATLWLLCSLQFSAAAMAQEASDSPKFWLERLGPALTKTTYSGVFVYARGDQVSSMQVAHRYHNGRVEERLVLQDGEAGEIVRKGLDVVCVLPDTGRMELTRVIPSGPFAEAFSNQLVPVDRWYRPELIGNDRIAGHDVVRLALNARDELRYSHHLWLEKSTGLPLKGKVMNHAGEVLEYFHFTSLTISDTLSDQAFEIRSEGREISRTLKNPNDSAPAQSVTMGFSVRWTPAGFHPAAAPASGHSNVMAFSDGLASFSVFVEAAEGVDMPTGTSRIGATTVYMQRLDADAGDFMITVVGEVPLETALKVADSVDIEDSQMIGAALE